MWKLPRIMSAALIPLALAPMGASGLGAGATSKGPVSCDIQITDVPGGVRLEPVALAEANLSGAYQFEVAKTSAAGTSTTSQGGSFAAQAGRPVVLSTTDLDAQGSLLATLTVSWQGGSLSCEKRYPSR